MTIHKGTLRVVGIDPGPVTGIVGLNIHAGYVAPRWAQVMQCDAGSLESILDGLYRSYSVALVLAVERFVTGPRAARSSTSGAGKTTRDVVTLCARWAVRESIDRYVQRSAAEVKPWATDARLQAVGLLAATRGMQHARDAARHALYAAVKDCGVADPLSVRAGAA